MKLFITLSMTLCLSGCMSTRVALDPRWNTDQKAVYEDYYDYYFFGLSGRATVDLQKVCMDQKVYAFKRFKGAEDAIITALTLGIYSPVTVQVWCGG